MRESVIFFVGASMKGGIFIFENFYGQKKFLKTDFEFARFLNWREKKFIFGSMFRS